jgi:uncharacterized protein YukE
MEAGAKAMALTIQDYLAAEEAIHDKVAAQSRKADVAVQPWANPLDSTSSLGAARGGATPYWGQSLPSGGEFAARAGSSLVMADAGLGPAAVLPWVTSQSPKIAATLAEAAADLEDTRREARDRLDRLGQAELEVTEAQDPTTYLVAPSKITSELDNVRWSAGPLLGGVDWVFEQIFGYSLLEDVILRPIAGDWGEIGAASGAWENVDGAFVAVAKNLSGAAVAVASAWRGQGSAAFVASMGAGASAMTGVSYAAGYISSLVNAVAVAAKLGGVAIAKALDILVTVLIKLAVKLAVPVAGWAVALAEAYFDVKKVIGAVKIINTALNLIIDAISDALRAKAKVADVRMVVYDLGEAAARGMAR